MNERNAGKQAETPTSYLEREGRNLLLSKCREHSSYTAGKTTPILSSETLMEEVLERKNMQEAYITNPGMEETERCFMNRRIRIRTYGGVRGRRGNPSPTRSVCEPKGAHGQTDV